jgi:cell division protein FtsL
MRDWIGGIETKNYSIKSNLDTCMLSELMRAIVALVIVAGALLFYSWVRSQIVNTGYESQQLFAEKESLLRIQKQLILEEETMKSPERIDTIARNELHMTPLRPNQILLQQPYDAGRSSSTVMAMVDSGAVNSQEASQTSALETDRNN